MLKSIKIPTGPTKIFLVNSLGDLEVQKNKCVLGPNFPQVKSLPPQKKTLPKPNLPVLMNIILPKKIAWVQQKHPSNQVPQTDVICKLDK